MKKILFFASCVALLASCEPKVPQTQFDALKAQLDSVAEANSQMAEVITSVNGAMSEIAVSEGIIFVDDEGNDLKDKNAVLSRMQAIRDRMAKQRQELEEQKKKLANSRYRNSELQKLIDQLNAQIAEKDAQIADLQSQLQDSKASIEDLKNRLNDMTIAKQKVEVERNQIQEIANKQEIELNTVYYVIDTKKNLKAQGLIEGVFKKRADYDNMDASKFTKADMRELTSISIPSKSAKLITEKPAGTYTLTPQADGTTLLEISDIVKFWSASPYLIIQK